uniref:C-type lectin domain-containing protein n=1 Tax=Strigamia maritima TaxID=126957 RepID=T1JGW0_STRMM
MGKKVQKNYWIGLEGYTMKVQENKMLYWKWNNTDLDMEYENWCDDQTITEDLVCAYVRARNKEACWVFSNCEKTSTVSAVWIGLESYIQMFNGNRYLYWRWSGLGNDVQYKNWCPVSSTLQREAMCGYTTLDTMCWMAEKCTFNDVSSFVCEDKLASINNAAHAFQHHLAVSYHKGPGHYLDKK